MRGIHQHALHGLHLMRVISRQNHLADAMLMGRQHQRQRPANGHQPAVQGQFSQQQDVACIHRADLARGNDDRHGDRQVEGRALLAQIRRGQVHRHMAAGRGEAVIFHGGIHALTAFAHGGVRQANHGEGKLSA